MCAHSKVHVSVCGSVCLMPVQNKKSVIPRPLHDNSNLVFVIALLFLPPFIPLPHLLSLLEDQEYLMLSQKWYMDTMPGMFSCELICI